MSQPNHPTRPFTYSLVGVATLLVGFLCYWATLLLINHHPAFIPNAERRAAMFRFLNHHRQSGNKRPPQQGDHWIF